MNNDYSQIELESLNEHELIDNKILKKISKKVLAALETIISEGPEKAMSLYN